MSKFIQFPGHILNTNNINAIRLGEDEFIITVYLNKPLINDTVNEITWKYKNKKESNDAYNYLIKKLTNM